MSPSMQSVAKKKLIKSSLFANSGLGRRTYSLRGLTTLLFGGTYLIAARIQKIQTFCVKVRAKEANRNTAIVLYRGWSEIKFGLHKFAALQFFFGPKRYH